MKTMFLSHDGINNCAKKKFQKPNILRRNTKGPTVKANVPRRLETTLPISQENVNLSCIGNIETLSKSNPTPLKLPEYENNDLRPTEASFDSNSAIDTALIEPDFLSSNGEENVSQCAELNVESFLNDTSTIRSPPLLAEHNILSLKRDWCLDFLNEAQQIIIEDQDGSELASLHAADDRSVSVSIIEPLVELHENTPVKNVGPVDTVTTSDDVPTFECDVPGCNKKFKNKERVTRHKRTHLPERGAPKEPRLITVECPARRRGAKEMEACAKIFLFREALTKHMKEDHSSDDAMYICIVCGRRFFWSLGLRAHSRAHATRAAPKRAITCQWPGCGRVFHQPCRLREHQRAHTGDKPYPCSHPNCNWSFRTASKLLRHARCHTGERRHACALCGHAFPRREHLRKHTASHHALLHYCNHPGCQRRFISVDALARHIRTRHKQDLFADDVISAKPTIGWKDVFSVMDSLDDQTLVKSTSSKSNTTSHTITNNTPKPTKKRQARSKVKAGADKTQAEVQVAKWKELPISETSEKELIELEVEPDWNLYSSEEVEPAEWHVYEADTAVKKTAEWDASTDVDVDESGKWQASPVTESGADESGEWHAARTHCTWPLAPRPPEDLAPYTLEEDVQVELSEGSESNTYTIRSDLFLHGNLLTNEDSEHIPGVSAVPDSGLSLMDAHPTVGLLQEDLIYTDAAVDESSFRVLLLSGEELV